MQSFQNFCENVWSHQPDVSVYTAELLPFVLVRVFFLSLGLCTRLRVSLRFSNLRFLYYAVSNVLFISVYLARIVKSSHYLYLSASLYDSVKLLGQSDVRLKA